MTLAQSPTGSLSNSWYRAIVRVISALRAAYGGRSGVLARPAVPARAAPKKPRNSDETCENCLRCHPGSCTTSQPLDRHVESAHAWPETAEYVEERATQLPEPYSPMRLFPDVIEGVGVFVGAIGVAAGQVGLLVADVGDDVDAAALDPGPLARLVLDGVEVDRRREHHLGPLRVALGPHVHLGLVGGPGDRVGTAGDEVGADPVPRRVAPDPPSRHDRLAARLDHAGGQRRRGLGEVERLEALVVGERGLVDVEDDAELRLGAAPGLAAQPARALDDVPEGAPADHRDVAGVGAGVVVAAGLLSVVADADRSLDPDHRQADPRRAQTDDRRSLRPRRLPDVLRAQPEGPDRDADQRPEQGTGEEKRQPAAQSDGHGPEDRTPAPAGVSVQL